MLTGAPRLSIRRPSPTTIEYTVTTTPRPSLTYYSLLTLVHVLRLTIGVIVLLLNFAKYQGSPYGIILSPTTYTVSTLPTHTLQSVSHYLLTIYYFSPLSQSFDHSVSRIPFLVLIPLSILLLQVLLTPLHQTETLLLLRTLGIQISTSPTSYLSYLLHPSIPYRPFLKSTKYCGISTTSPHNGWETQFIPVSAVQDLFINEVFSGWGVVYMLGVVVEGREEVMVVFGRTRPGREVVERVWRGARGALWGVDGKDGANSNGTPAENG